MLSFFPLGYRCGSRTGEQNGAKRRKRGAAEASWLNMVYMAPWYATPSPCPTLSSLPPKMASWIPALLGYLVSSLSLKLRPKSWQPKDIYKFLLHFEGFWNTQSVPNHSPTFWTSFFSKAFDTHTHTRPLLCVFDIHTRITVQCPAVLEPFFHKEAV